MLVEIKIELLINVFLDFLIGTTFLKTNLFYTDCLMVYCLHQSHV